MSRQVEMLRVAYDDASRGDWDTAFDTAARDLEFIPPDLAPEAEPLRGVEQFKAWWADQQEAFGDLSIEVDGLREGEGCVVVLLRLRVRPHGTDASFELSIAHLCTLRGGRMVRLEVFPERAKAFEAAGLRE